MNTDYLKDFEEMNNTTESVFDLGESGLLIILKDGTNLTSWDDIDDFDDVLYISEDLSKQVKSSNSCYCDNAEVIIIQNYSRVSQLRPFRKTLKSLFSGMNSLIAFYAINWDISKEIDVHNMFFKCYSLEYVFLENWDTSNVENFWGMFADCCSLKTLDGLENFDLSSTVNMESMFESCISLEDVSFASNWDMSNVENIFEMFRDCYSLRDVSCLNWNFDKLKNGDNLFINCNNIEKLPEWYDEEFREQFGIRKHLEIADDSFIYKIIKGFDEQDIFVAVSYIENEEMLKELIKDDSIHYYAKRAALLNPNLNDSNILEDYALNSYGAVERAYAIENPNFTNAKLLKKIAENDQNYLVRFKAERKLKELLYNKYQRQY